MAFNTNIYKTFMYTIDHVVYKQPEKQSKL